MFDELDTEDEFVVVSELDEDEDVSLAEPLAKTMPLLVTAAPAAVVESARSFKGFVRVGVAF